MTFKTLLGGALLACAATGAAAQSVTIYGLIDTGVEYLDNIGAAHSHLYRMPTITAGQLPSRWGLRGNEDLGGGLKAVFTLESGFAPDQGTLNQSGRIFGRQAFVGLGNAYGTVTLGRQWTMTFYALLDSDVIGPAAFAMASFDPYFPNARADNSVAYRGTFSGVTVGATYSLGRDTQPTGPNPGCAGEGNPAGCKEWSGLLKYDSADWGIGTATDVVRGGNGADTAYPGRSVTFANPSDRDTRSYLNGYVKFAGAKVGAGVIYRKVDTVIDANDFSSKLYYLGISYPLAAAFVLDAQVLRIDHNHTLNADANMLVLRGNYNLSKRTALYATVGRVNNSAQAAYSISGTAAAVSAPLAGESQTGVMLGMRHSF